MRGMRYLWPVLGAVLLTVGCGSGAVQPSSTGTPSPRVQGTADVAYAGSLQVANETVVGPAFTKATGITYRGRGGGAIGIAQEIKDGVIHPNVFESMGTGPIQALEPTLTGWYAPFAQSPLVVVYNPRSPFGSQLAAIAKGNKPLSDLFALMAKPGFRLGRTNPATDPQGQAFWMMIHLAVKRYHLPAGTAQSILGSVENPQQIFAEEAILSQLQSGQLDAASAFLSEALQRHLPYITMPPQIDMGDPAYAANYRTASITLPNGKVIHGTPLVVYITTLDKNPNAAAGKAFARFVLSPQGIRLYRQEGYRPVPITPTGSVPAGILHG